MSFVGTTTIYIPIGLVLVPIAIVVAIANRRKDRDIADRNTSLRSEATNIDQERAEDW